MSDDTHKLYANVFRIKKKKPKTMADILYYHLTFLKHLTSPEIITRTRKQVNNGRAYTYILNNEYCNKHFELIHYRNPYYLNYDIQNMRQFNLISDTNNDPFSDD